VNRKIELRALELRKVNQPLDTEITERKKAEEEVRENEAKYRSLYQEFLGILDAIPDSLVLLDRDLKMVWANEVATVNPHVSPDNFIGRQCYKTRHKRTEPCEVCPVLDCFASHKPKIGENTTPDGKIWELRAFPIFDDSGEVRGVIEVAHNITERKQAQEKLKESENRYRTIFENTGTVMLIIEDDMTISYANAQFETFTGYTRQEVEGKKKWTEFVEKDDLAKMVTQHHLRRVDPGLATNSYEFRLVHRDGHQKNMLLTVDIIPGTKRSVASLIDITDRKQAEERLRKTTQRYHTILSQHYVGTLVVSEDNHIEYANQTFCDLFSLTDLPSDLIGLTVEKMLKKILPAYADPTGTLERIHERVILRQRFVGAEVLMSDGRILLVDFIPIIVDGKPSGKIWQHRDITEWQRVEKALRDSESKFRDLSDLLPQVVFEFDLQGCFTYANRAAFKMFGYPQADLEKGVNVLDVIAPVDRERAAVNITRISDKDMETGTEYTALRKNGEEFPIIVYSTPIHADENVIGLRGIVIDFTERKRAEDEKRRLEERLQRAEKMESLGTLAGGVAHDLNNVLGVVLGYAEILLMDMSESSSIRTRLLKILKGGEKAAAIVQDLLTLARRGVPSTREVINLNRVIADGQQSPEFEKLSTYHPSVEIKTDLEPDLLNISGSPVHLCKSLFNLVSNASESMPKGGIVTIRTANKYLDKPVYGYDEIREGDYVVLSVSDTGEGIPKADLKRIFEPFYTKKVMGRSGTGLGLAVVWGTVKDHHGYINVESEEGKGSTFTLYFPVTREDISDEAVALSLSAYMGKGESILVVDDVKEQRDLAAEMLQKLNYTVTTVSSGEEAVAYLQDHKVDLMVLDMIMDPGMDGLDTYRKALGIHPKQKAIIVSGFSETERVSAAQVLGAGSYVRKPYVIEKLGLTVRKELDRST